MNQTSFRPSRTSSLLTVAFGLALACVAGTAAAEEQPRSLLGLGAASIPEFEGSADEQVLPFVVGRVDLERYGSLRFAGVTVQYNLMGSDSPWAFGPVVSAIMARDEDVEDPVVRRLRKIDSTAEVGFFVEYGFADTLMEGDRLNVDVEARAGEGNQFSWGIAYQATKVGAFQYGVDLRATYANDKYMDTFFSVDADNNRRSGLPIYKAEAALKSASIGLTGTYDLTPRWALIGRLGVSRLNGDASDSPIVRLRGDSNSAEIGIAIGYRF
jgi:outer membrane scaffolding protein for murein synthesis (MipA/OmpV family)